MPVARLAGGVGRSQAWALRLVPTSVVLRYWEYAALFDQKIVAERISDLASRPQALLERLDALQIQMVVFPDGDLLSPLDPAAVNTLQLASSLAARGLRTVVVTDPRSRPDEPGSWPGMHRHRVEVSTTTAPAVVEVLGRSDAASGRGGAIHTLAPASGGGASAHRFATREQLITSLAKTIVCASGVRVRAGGAELLEAADACGFDLADLRGESVLLITPRPSESIELARQLGNYLEPRPVVLDDGGLWRAGAELCMRILDPCGQASGDDVDEFAAAGATIGLLGKQWWGRRIGARPLAAQCKAALIRLSTPVAAPPSPSGAEAPYDAAVEEARAILEPLVLSSDPAVRDWAASLDDRLAQHRRLLLRGDVAALCDLAHEIGDLRASGFLQAASGSQRWLAQAAAARSATTSRLAVAAEIDRELRRRRPRTRIEPVEGAASLFVTHIQRSGMDHADHVLLCRTLARHMPYTAVPHARASAVRRLEDALFYRALRSARRSVHLLSVGNSPYLDLFDHVIEHRRS